MLRLGFRACGAARRLATAPKIPVTENYDVRKDLERVNGLIYERLAAGALTDEIRNHGLSLFDGSGKMFRPRLVLLLARLIDGHVGENQIRAAAVTEMIHTASLVHDDIIDKSEIRRQKQSTNAIYGNRMAALAGSFVVAEAMALISKTGDAAVIRTMAKINRELIRGEIYQATNKQNHFNFNHELTRYIDKTYLKTGSLIAHSCSACARLSQNDLVQKNLKRSSRYQVTVRKDPSNGPAVERLLYNFGRNAGIAFQIVDDCLDFTASSEEFGKPSGGADLKLGLTTGPSLYAAENDAELQVLIKRGYKSPGDVSKMIQAVHDSDALEKSYDLARHYAVAAERCLNQLNRYSMDGDDAKQQILDLIQVVLSRKS